MGALPVADEFEAIPHCRSVQFLTQPNERSNLNANACPLVRQDDDARVVLPATQPATMQTREVVNIRRIDGPTLLGRESQLLFI